MSTAAQDDLLAAALAGRPDWAAIYGAHRARMLRVAQSVVGADGVLAGGVGAMDVVSEVMRKLQADGLSPGVDDLAAYLATMTSNTAKTAWRRAHETRPDADGRRALREESSGDLGVFERADPTVDVTAQAEDNVLCEAIHAHMHLLTPNEQRAVWGQLRGERRAETAAEMGISPQRVSQLVREGSLKVLRATGYLPGHNDV